MVLKFVVHLVLFVFLVAASNARVRIYPFRSYHPPILTRPRTTTTASPPNTTTAAPTTTPEPPEQEQEEAGTTWQAADSQYLTHALTTAYFGSVGGGEENEWEDGMTTQSFWHRPTRGYKRLLETTTTAPAATTTETTEEPPENEQQGRSQRHNSNHEPASGSCFCTPFSFCPRGSIKRGGHCWDLSWFSGHPYIRCCYRPSVAKRFFRYVEKRK